MDSNARSRNAPDAIAALFELLMLQRRDMPALALPSEFPGSISVPRFVVGDRCRWIPNPATDWDIVIGQVFVPIEADQLEPQPWAWMYPLLLDSDSPSRSWLIADWAEEADLELYEND